MVEGKKRKILIIDDNVDFAGAIKAILESGPYAVEMANSTEEADRKLEGEPPDLIILDILMQKGAEGIILSRKLKKDPNLGKIPIIMLTSVTKQSGFRFIEDDPRHSNFLPVDEFMEKPVSPADLFSRIEKVLGAKGSG